MLAFIDSPIQILVVIVVLLIVFGPQKLPEMMNQLGKAIRELKRTTSDLSSSFSMDDRYDAHYDPPRFDSYGNRTSNTADAELPAAEAPPALSGAHTADTQMPRGDYAASAMADTAQDYGAGIETGTSPAAPAGEINIRPAEGAVPRSS